MNIVENNEIKELMDNVLEIKAMMKIVLNKVNSLTLGEKKNFSTDDSLIKDYLPLKTVEIFLQFEDMLNNENVEKQLVS